MDDSTSNNIQYLRNTKVSPACNLLEVTNVLHPVVSKCLRGWPVLFTPITYQASQEIAVSYGFILENMNIHQYLIQNIIHGI